MVLKNRSIFNCNLKILDEKSFWKKKNEKEMCQDMTAEDKTMNNYFLSCFLMQCLKGTIIKNRSVFFIISFVYKNKSIKQVNLHNGILARISTNMRTIVWHYYTMEVYSKKRKEIHFLVYLFRNLSDVKASYKISRIE